MFTETTHFHNAKELSFCHKLKYFYPYILATQCRRPLIFQTINSVRPNNPSLKYQRFIPTGCRDIEIRKFEVVAKTQFLLKNPNQISVCLKIHSKYYRERGEGGGFYI